MQSGIIINSYKIGEKDGIVKILSQSGEIISGFVKYGFSSKNHARIQVANLVNFSWIGRENSLGTVKLDIIKQYGAATIGNKIAFLSIVAICSVINTIIAKNTQHQANLYQSIAQFLENNTTPTSNTNIIEEYLKQEAYILAQSGYFDSQSQYNTVTNIEFLTQILNKYNKQVPHERLMFEKYIVKYLENNI